jgi:hypothetical protein
LCATFVRPASQDAADDVGGVAAAYAADDRIKVLRLAKQRALRQIAQVEPYSDGEAGEHDENKQDERKTMRARRTNWFHRLLLFRLQKTATHPGPGS